MGDYEAMCMEYELQARELLDIDSLDFSLFPDEWMEELEKAREGKRGE